MKQFKIVGEDLSDGYHTFNELYDHRNLLFINLCLSIPERCDYRLDGTKWFVLYCELPTGQISYHVPIKFEHLIKDKISYTTADIFDGHDSLGVIERLYQNDWT